MTDVFEWTPESVYQFWGDVQGTRLSELAFARLTGRQLLRMVMDRMPPPGSRVLDLGGGEGWLAGFLIGYGYKVAVHEPSPERRRVAEERLGELDGYLGTEAEGPFDAVFCCEVIEHALDPEALADEIAGAVRAGGLVVVTCPWKEDLDLGSCVCPRCRTVFHRWQHVRSVGTGWIEELLGSRGIRREWMALTGFEDADVTALREHGRVPARHAWEPDAEAGGRGWIVFVGRKAK